MYFNAIPIEITSPAIRLKFYAINAGIKYKSNVVLLAKSKLYNIEVLISKALIDSNVSHDQIVLVNDKLKEYDNTIEEIKNLKTSSVN